MSEYTMEIREICESLAGETEGKGYNNVASIIESARPKIFDFTFPIYDENYRATLETGFLRHFYTREIGVETYGRWKMFLEDKLNLIMPKYNGLYKEATWNINPLYDSDYTRENNSESRGTLSDSRSSSASQNGNETGTSSMTTKNTSHNNATTTPGTETITTKTGEDKNTTTYGKTTEHIDNRDETVTTSGTNTDKTTFGSSTELKRKGKDSVRKDHRGKDTDNTWKHGTDNYTKTDKGTISTKGDTTRTGTEERQYGEHITNDKLTHGEKITHSQNGTKTTEEGGTEKRKYSDTPFNSLTDIDKGKYLTNYTVTEPGKTTTEKVSDGYYTQDHHTGDDERKTTSQTHTDKTTYNNVQDAKSELETRNLSGTNNEDVSMNNDRTLEYNSYELETTTLGTTETNSHQGIDQTDHIQGTTKTTKGNGGKTADEDKGQDEVKATYGTTERVKNVGVDTENSWTYTDETANGNTTNTSSQTGSSSSNQEQQTHTTDGYVTKVLGKTAASGSYAQAILTYRETLINIDQMIYNECEDLFMQLW